MKPGDVVVGVLAGAQETKVRPAVVTASAGGLDRIQFLLGHVSVRTSERHPGCKQRLQNAVNDRIGVEPPVEHAQVGDYTPCGLHLE